MIGRRGGQSLRVSVDVASAHGILSDVYDIRIRKDMAEIARDDRYFFQMYGLTAQPPATLNKALAQAIQSMHRSVYGESARELTAAASTWAATLKTASIRKGRARA